MEININQALKLFNLHGFVTKEAIKDKYRKLANIYHPDKNNGNLKMMQDINIAYHYLSKYTQPYSNHYYYETQDDSDYFKSLGLEVTKKDNKIWISGKTYEYREILKKKRFKWEPQLKIWYRFL